jgi:threonine dehydratase
MSFEVNDRQRELKQIFTEMEAKGMKGLDLSDNEMAKSHGRYLVGGRKQVQHERLFQFFFPERPGALRRFLTALPSGWNVSLFHYRNYGADVGKVLVGIQVPPEEESQFMAFLSNLKFPYRDETTNPIYAQFLR